MARPKKHKGAKGKKPAVTEKPATTENTAVAEAPQPATDLPPPEPAVADLPKDVATAEEPKPAEEPAKVDEGAGQATSDAAPEPPVQAADATVTSAEPETVAAEPKATKKSAKKDEEAPAKKGKTKADKADEEYLALIGQLKERYGGAIELLENIPVDGTPTMSTGNFGLDVATFGGLRRGRLYRFWGRPKSAKTGSALNVVEQFTSNHCGRCFEHRLKCKCKGDFVYAKALYVDVEGRVADNQPWALKHGIHPQRLIFVSPKGGEMVVDVADAVLRSNVGIGLIVIDSIAQITPQAEVLKAAEKGITIGRAAQLINSAMRKWVCSIVSKDIAASNKPTVILINQIRNKTDGMGSPDVMPGGLGQGYVSACDIKFTQKSAHYLKKNAKGQWEDKTTSFDGTGFRPGPDDAPNYFEIDYKVTDSGICPPRRFGTFNYWLRAGHGHRVGDVDNLQKVWEYVKAYKLMEALKVGYRLDTLEARTQRELEAAFKADPDVQDRVWNALVEKLKDPDTDA